MSVSVSAANTEAANTKRRVDQVNEPYYSLIMETGHSIETEHGSATISARAKFQQ
jgi:hypothetical protein